MDRKYSIAKMKYNVTVVIEQFYNLGDSYFGFGLQSDKARRLKALQKQLNNMQ